MPANLRLINGDLQLGSSPHSADQTPTDALTPHLTKIINASLAADTVPAFMKKALVTPVLKKTGLNKEELKNY